MLTAVIVFWRSCEPQSNTVEAWTTSEHLPVPFVAWHACLDAAVQTRVFQMDSTDTA